MLRILCNYPDDSQYLYRWLQAYPTQVLRKIVHRHFVEIYVIPFDFDGEGHKWSKKEIAWYLRRQRRRERIIKDIIWAIIERTIVKDIIQVELNDEELNLEPCKICGHLALLVEHHWYEGPDMEKHAVMVCPSCNSAPELKTKKGDGNHILPKFNIQKHQVTRRLKSIA